MSKLTYQDLAEKGLHLTKQEALKLQPHISKISQHGADGLNDVQFEKGSQHTTEDQLQHQSAGQANTVEQSTGFETKQADQKPKDEPVEQKKLVAGNFNKKGNTLAADGYKIGDMHPRIEDKPKDEPDEETEDFTVTQEYLDAHPDLVADGCVAGETIQLPKQ